MCAQARLQVSVSSGYDLCHPWLIGYLDARPWLMVVEKFIVDFVFAFIRPPDIHVGGLIFYQAFFFFLFIVS